MRINVNLPPPSLSGIDKLLWIMNALRTPETGCPWDLEQTFETIAPYTVEEAYEVADAIEHGDMDDLRNELGDLLFQVVFHSQLSKELHEFDFNDVAEAISEKMLRRHPHVFGDEQMRGSDAQTIAWEAMKAEERATKTDSSEPTSALDDVALTLPAMIRSQKLQKRAARVGFDWPNASDILDKLDEETSELKAANANQDEQNIEEELGDMMFVVVNLCRKLGVDAEESLKKANQKFERRFRGMERLSEKQGTVFSDLNLEQQEQLWQEIKLRSKMA